MRQSIVNDLKIGVRLSVEIQKVIEKAEKTTGRLTGCDEYDIKVLASGPFAVHFFAPPEKICKSFVLVSIPNFVSASKKCFSSPPSLVIT